MKGVRFYEEFTHKRRGESAGTVVAILTDTGRAAVYGGRDEYEYDAIVAVFDRPNSPVASSAVARSYLQESCKHVSEKRARGVHPALFERLDEDD